MRFFAILFGIMLLFGCTTTAPAEDTTPSTPAQPEPPAVNDTETANDTASMTCDEYCKGQPHVQCVGEWNISGTYPDCVCSYECESVDLNVTDEEDASEELEDLVPKSNKTLNQMLDEALAQIRLDFFKKHDGSFEQTTYTWKRSGTVDCIPGEIVLDTAPLTDVKFDGKTISSIQAAGLMVFDDGVEPVSRGILIFMNTTPVLPLAGEDFELEYFHSTEHRYMHDCKVSGKELSRNLDGKWVTSSYISCMSVEGLETD